MKKLIQIAILALAAGTIPLAAQGEGQGRGRGSREGHRMQAVVDYLGLTAAQQQEWQTLTTQHREAMKPFYEEGQALHQKLQESLEADEPDVVVGEAAKAVHAHRAAAKQAREAFEGQLTSILTAEQKVKYEAFKAARGMGRNGGPGKGHRGGHHGGPGVGAGEGPVEG